MAPSTKLNFKVLQDDATGDDERGDFGSDVSIQTRTGKSTDEPKQNVISKGVVTNNIYYHPDLGDSEWVDGFLVLNNPLKEPPKGVEKKVVVKFFSSPVLEVMIPRDHPNLVSVKDFSWPKGLCAIEYVRTDFASYLSWHARYFFCENVVNRHFKENIRQMIKATDHLHKMGRVFTNLSIKSVFYTPDPSGYGIKIKLNHLACVPPKKATKQLKLNDWRDLALLLEHVQVQCRAYDAELQELCNFLKYNKDLQDMESRALGQMFFWKEKRRDFLDRFERMCFAKSKFVADLEKFKVDIVPDPNWTMVVDADLLAHLNSKLKKPNACYDGKSVVDWIRFCHRTTMHIYTIPEHVKETLGIWNRNQALLYFKRLQPKMLLTIKKIVDKAHLKEFWSYFQGGDENV